MSVVRVWNESPSFGMVTDSCDTLYELSLPL